MSGYHGRGRYGQRRPSVPRDGRIERANKYAGPCHYCGQTVEAGKGQLFGHNGEWQVVHLPHRWHGSPVSGGYIGGCPGEAAKLNTRADTPEPTIVHLTLTGYDAGKVICGAPRDADGAGYVHAGYHRGGANVCPDCAHAWGCRDDDCERCAAILAPAGR